MKSIGTKFLLAIGGLTLIFSSMILYRAWFTAKIHAEELTSQQAKLALEFDLAIRQYAAEAIRPAIEKRIGKDELIIEAMSTSFISRNVFDKVREKFPDYVIKFSSDNPRNPVNLAGPEELTLLKYFEENPQTPRWVGKLYLNGKEYFAYLSAMRIDPSCLHCHGKPEDAPKSLLERYGAKAGFYRKVGDVAGMDVIAIPMAKVNATIRADATKNILATAFFLLLLLAGILLTFRFLVSSRLKGIANRFQLTATQPGATTVATIPVLGNDEIGLLARSFNSLATRLQELHHSLEQRVEERTAEVRREQETLQHLLRSSDHERQLIAYEIHDDLAQQLASAIMYFESYSYMEKQNPTEAAKSYAMGIMLIRQSLDEARRLISGVRPPILDEAGVVAAIDHLVQDRQYTTGEVQIEFQEKVAFDRLAPVLENAIFRIVSEGLMNALAHSRSEKVLIELVQVDKELQIGIQDWGEGFNLDDEQNGYYGLKGIRERARLLGGTTLIETAPGEGTRIFVKLPVVLREGEQYVL